MADFDKSKFDPKAAAEARKKAKEPVICINAKIQIE